MSADTAFFSAVVRSIHPGSGSPPRINPRPLKVDPASLEARLEHLADVPAAVLRSRSEVLQRQGIPEENATKP